MISDVRSSLLPSLHTQIYASDCTELFVPVVTKRMVTTNRHGKIKLQLIQHIDEQPLSPYKLSASTNLNQSPLLEAHASSGGNLWLAAVDIQSLEALFRFIDFKSKGNVIWSTTPYAVTATMPFSILPKLPIYTVVSRNQCDAFSGRPSTSTISVA